MSHSIDSCPNLTPKQEAFARHYAASGNGAAAARAAGYAPDSAKQTAHDLLQSPAVRARIDTLEDAHGRTLRGEVAILLDRLDAAHDLALEAGDYRAMIDIIRLQAQLAALTGQETARRRGLLYDRIGGPGPLARSRDCLDPHAIIDPDAHAAGIAAEVATETAEDDAALAALREEMAAGVDQETELAEIAGELSALEAELREADPDFSLPLAGPLPRAAGGRPPATARAALLASAAPVRATEPARRAA